MSTGPMRSPRPSGADRLLQVCVPPLLELQRHNGDHCYPFVLGTVSAGLCWKHRAQRGRLESLLLFTKMAFNVPPPASLVILPFYGHLSFGPPLKIHLI